MEKGKGVRVSSTWRWAVIRTPRDSVTAGVSVLFMQTQGWLEAVWASVPRVVAAPWGTRAQSMLGVRKGESSEPGDL